MLIVEDTVMTVMEANQIIGKIVTVRFESIEIPCRITDVKSSYGKTRYEIQPLHGKGTQWIEISRAYQIREVE